MEAPESKPSEAKQLLIAFAQWAACLGLFLVLIGLASYFESKVLWYTSLGFYICAGIALSRIVLRRIIDWHPNYNTLYNVTSAKLKFFFLWPTSYFFLFIRLGINKLL